MKIENINELIPVTITSYRKENGLEVLDKIFYPVIYFIEERIDGDLRKPQNNNRWVCEYWERGKLEELFIVEGESIEELIGKVWEYIEKHEFNEIYDLTYNFKKYELD